MAKVSPASRPAGSAGDESHERPGGRLVCTGLTGSSLPLGRLWPVRVVLDVMATRNDTIRVYDRLGFHAVEPYATPHVPMRFMGLDLSDSEPRRQE